MGASESVAGKALSQAGGLAQPCHTGDMTSDIHIAGRGPTSPDPGSVADLLDGIQLSADFTHVTVIASDGYRASIPIQTLRTGGLLSLEDGGWRLKVVDGDTLCWNVKRVVGLQPTRGRADDDIPENPNH